jgi:AcrR family transcriptional regulator
MPSTPRRPAVSRRDRPAKAPLSREAIVVAALELLDRESLEAVSMRGVAQLLDTGPASLYVYVANRDELLALVYDRALADVPLPKRRTGSWRHRFERLARAHVEVLTRHRGLAFVGLGSIPTGPNALAISECMLALLDEGGVDGPTSAWAVDLITLYLNAGAAEQSLYDGKQDRGHDEASYLDAVRATFESVPAEQFPMIHALRELLLTGSGTDRFRWGLDVLLAGLQHTPVPKR